MTANPHDHQYEQEVVLNSILSIQRPGTPDLAQYMEEGGFFTQPASTKYHANWEGGLLEHSMELGWNLDNFIKDLELDIPQESRDIVAYCHDLCKMGAYLKKPKGDGWKWNYDHSKGHSLLSIARIQRFVELTEWETKAILYHMGPWGSSQTADKQGEYPILDLTRAWQAWPDIKYVYFSDEMSNTQGGLIKKAMRAELQEEKEQAQA